MQVKPEFHSNSFNSVILNNIFNLPHSSSEWNQQYVSHVEAQFSTKEQSREKNIDNRHLIPFRSHTRFQ